MSDSISVRQRRCLFSSYRPKKRCYFVFFRAQIQRKEIVRCKRLGRWSDIYISSDRFLPRALISLLRSLNAYFLPSFYRLLPSFLPSFLPSCDFIYLILRPTDQHYFVPIFRSLWSKEDARGNHSRYFSLIISKRIYIRFL